MCPLSQGSLSDLVLTNKPNVTFLNLERHKLKFKKKKKSHQAFKNSSFDIKSEGKIVKKIKCVAAWGELLCGKSRMLDDSWWKEQRCQVLLLVSLGCSSIRVTLDWDNNPQWSVHMLRKPLCDCNVERTRAKHSSFRTRTKNSSVCPLG